MIESRSRNVKMKIEFHFEDKDELPEQERIDPKVRIVQFNGTGELLIEKSLDDPDKIVINAGNARLELHFTDFMYQVWSMMKEDFLR